MQDADRAAQSVTSTSAEPRHEGSVRQEVWLPSPLCWVIGRAVAASISVPMRCIHKIEERGLTPSDLSPGRKSSSLQRPVIRCGKGLWDLPLGLMAYATAARDIRLRFVSRPRCCPGRDPSRLPCRCHGGPREAPGSPG